jgi:hypothetical protein
MFFPLIVVKSILLITILNINNTFFIMFLIYFFYNAFNISYLLFNTQRKIIKIFYNFNIYKKKSIINNKEIF